MKKLKNILQNKYTSFLLCFLAILYSIYQIHNLESKYQKSETEINGTLISLKTNGNQIQFVIKGREKVMSFYYAKTEEELKLLSNMKIGSYITVVGTLNEANKNTNFNLFNYKKYLKSKTIFWVISVEKIKINALPKGLYKIKNNVLNRIYNSPNFEYLNAFLLGDSSLLEYKETYQELGISHLFAVSGMHITLLSSILLKILKKLKKDYSYLIVILFLFFYCWLLGDSPSANRAFLLFLFSYINHKLNLKLKPLFLLAYSFSILLFYNPFYLLQTGFQFSFMISFFLMLGSKKEDSYMKSLLYTSFISSLASFPLSIYHFHQFHFASFLFNLALIPFVSTVLFPISILSIFMPFLEPILSYIIYIFHLLVSFFSIFSIFKILFMKISIIYYIIYYIILFCSFKISKKILVLFFIGLSVHFFLPYLINTYYVDVIDVGQGDSALIRFPNMKQTILIDTGGKMQYEVEGWKKKDDKSDAEKILIPYFKSLGISKINTIVLTHGDFDHMGEAINLVNNFKVEKVIFNCGEFNELEQELIKVLDKKKIPYYSCIKELSIDDNKLYFLNNKDYGNENDNSNVIYTELNGYKFMFMGDASSTTEKEILSEYNLSDVDVLKVGHHGSKTSSSKDFINETNPKYSIISVGKKNCYGHPNKEVLENLKDSKIYRTDQDGSIMFRIKNNKLRIETCSP